MIRYLQQSIVQPEACVSKSAPSAPWALKYKLPMLRMCRGQSRRTQLTSKGTCQTDDEAQLVILDTRLAGRSYPACVVAFA